jgi:hypothetical protein
MKKQTTMVINVEEMAAGYEFMAVINLEEANLNLNTVDDGYEVYQLQA